MLSAGSFGERYFQARERLGSVMAGISSLAGEIGAELPEPLPLDKTRSGIAAPFLFVVCGEVNAGKSSLINGLFGQELCRTNILPETDKVYFYKYGETDEDEALTKLLTECRRPIGFLKDFQLVDTPGTNSVIDGHQNVTTRFLSEADLIFFVFPVTNPWGAATWNYLSSLDPGLLDRVVFIVQQADQRDPTDIEVIQGHLRDLAMKRIGRIPPIFAVSAKCAMAAKQSATPDAGALAASGYTALEGFISHNVCESPRRREMLERWRDSASKALRSVEDQMENQTRGIHHQQLFLDGIEREIAAIRDFFVQRLPFHVDGVTGSFEDKAAESARILRRKLGVFSTFARLIHGDQTSSALENDFLRQLTAAVERLAGKDTEEMTRSCQEHWEDLRNRVGEAMVQPLPPESSPEICLSQARAKFIERLGEAARESMSTVKFRQLLESDLRKRNRALKSFTVASLSLLSAGAACGAMRLPWLPLILCILSGAFAIGWLITAVVTRRRIVRALSDRLLLSTSAFIEALQQRYRSALHEFFAVYLSVLSPLRSGLVSEKLAIEPRLKRWQELFLTLKEVEQDIRRD